MKKTKLKRAAIILIALILVFSSPLQVAGAEAEAQNAAVENVNETVYGVIKEVGTNFYSVYTMGVTSPGEYRIYGDFSAAKNLTDDVEYRLDEQGVTLLFTKTYDNFSFQVENTPRLPGTHTGGIELPFILNYYIELDNQAVIVTGGESGHARLVIEVNANEKADRSLRENMVCQIQIPISNKVFKNIKTDMSGVLIGSTYTYSGMVLPGQSAKFVIEGDVEELSLDSITFSMMPYNISDIIEETGITSGITEMQEGSGNLLPGQEHLQKVWRNSRQVLDRSVTVPKLSTSQLPVSPRYGRIWRRVERDSTRFIRTYRGAEGIAAGLGQLDAEGSKLLEGFQQIRLNLVEMLTGNNQAGLLVEGLENIAYAIQNNPTMSRTERNRYLQECRDSASIPQEDYSELVESLEMYEQGLRSYVEGVTSLSAGASALSDGTARYVGGVGALADNFTQLASGVRAFRAGVSEFSEGINSLSAEVSVIPENSEKLDDGQE